MSILLLWWQNYPYLPHISYNSCNCIYYSRQLTNTIIIFFWLSIISARCTAIIPIDMTERELHYLITKIIWVSISAIVYSGARVSGRDCGRTVPLTEFWCILPGTEWRWKLGPIPMLAGNGSELRPFSTTRSITLQENTEQQSILCMPKYNIILYKPTTWN